MIKCLISDFSKVIRKKEFIQTIKSNHQDGKLLFIPSTCDDKSATQKYSRQIVRLFEENGVSFLGVDYIESTSDIVAIKEDINQYAIIFLMGGDTIQQNKFVSNLEFKGFFREYSGVVIGLSAGALNLCEQTLITPIDEEHIKETLILKGLGLVNVVVEVHFNVDNKVQVEYINETGLKVYGIPNDSAIIIDQNKILICGKVYLLDNGKITALTP